MIDSGQTFRVERILTLDQVLKWWEFIRGSLPELNALMPEHRRLDGETLLKMLLRCLEMGPTKALVAVFLSKNNKPLCWGIVFDNTQRFRPKSCVVFCVYSTGKAAGVVKKAIDVVLDWAKENEYPEIHAMSWTFSGARFRLFEKVWGFHRTATLFTRKV